MLNVFLRTIIIYLLLVAVTRFMNKRQIGQLQPFELVITIIIAELAALPVGDLNVPLFFGILPVFALLLMDSLFALLTYKSEKMRRLLNGKPSILIHNGRINEKELKRISYNLNDFLEQLRVKGYFNPDEVSSAVWETSGSLSLLPNSQKRPIYPEDVHVPTYYEGIPLTLIIEGTLQDHNLNITGFTEEWLLQHLQHLQIDQISQVYIAYLTTRGTLFVQEHGQSDILHSLQVLSPEGVRW